MFTFKFGFSGLNFDCVSCITKNWLVVLIAGDKIEERWMLQVNESNDAEKKKLKETLMAAEKLRREKWMDEQTRNLKDITVKGES